MNVVPFRSPEEAYRAQARQMAAEQSVLGKLGSFGRSYGDTLNDVIGMLASGVGEIPAGLAGIASLPFGLDTAADNVRAVRDALTWQPRSGGGEQAQRMLGELLQPVAEAEEALGNFGYDLAGPAGGTIAKTLPTAIAAGLPFVPKGAMTNAARAMVPSEMPQVKGFWGDVLPPLQLDAAPGKYMTEAQAIAAGYPKDQPWHPFWDNKLDKPFNEYTRTITEQKGLLPHREITPEDLQGTSLIPTIGDRTHTGSYLTHVGDRPLAKPVEIEGGHEFGLELPYMGAPDVESIWGSKAGEVTKYNNKIRPILEGGGDPRMVYLPGAHNMTNFSTMMTDSMLEQMLSGGLTKKAVKTFDKEMKTLRPEWPGLLSSNVREALNANGELRLAFSKVAQKNAYRKMGFPSASQTRFGLTSEKLMDVPLLHGGQMIARPTGQNVANPLKPHTTYDTQMHGDYIGGFQHGIPGAVLFPDFYAARRAAGTDPSDDFRSMWTSKPIQQADQKWLDGVMKWNDIVKEAGGAANMTPAGLQEALNLWR